MTVVAIIEADHLSASVKLPSGKRLSILKDVSLRVEEAGSAAIIGRSGSGKTTLLTLLGLMGRPTVGNLVIAGQTVNRLNDAAAALMRNKLMGFVFQSFSLISSLNVLENTELPYAYGNRYPQRLVRARALEMLKLVGLADVARRRVAQLSGGEQQRVAIARALVRHPKIILADEPTGSLDVETGQQVISLLRDAAASEGSCLVVVTHDADVAATMDTTWRLDSGIMVTPSKVGRNVATTRPENGLILGSRTTVDPNCQTE